MSESQTTASGVFRKARMSFAALEEMAKLGLKGQGTPGTHLVQGLTPVPGRPRIRMRAMKAPDVLNEAYDYDKPASFSRGMRVELGEATLLLVSGTASVNEQGESVLEGDFEAQCLRTFRNITRLLAAEEASWHDVVRTTCYLRDIERDYDSFNEIRTMFMNEIGLDPLPASTGIQARICRSDLLVEIEAMAILPRE